MRDCLRFALGSARRVEAISLRRVRFAASDAKTLAIPKSSTLTPCAPSMMFDGFKSRWMMPQACAASSTAQISMAIATARE